MSMSAQLPVRDVLTRLEDDAMAAKTTHGSSLSTETILVLERALADAVSANEELEDFSAFALRCLNVPYYLALWHDAEGGRSVERKLRALAYYDDYLERCVRHGVLEPKVRGLVEACVEEHEEARDGSSVLATAAASSGVSRERKIEMFRTERQLAKSIEALRAGRAGDAGDVEDLEDGDASEALRPLYLMMISHFAIKACGARQLVRQEIEMLGAVAAMSEDERMKATEGRGQSKENEEVMEKLREAVRGLSTNGKREALRAGVFKPSHLPPTMTVEQFGDMEVARMQEDEQQRAAAESEERRRKEQSLNGKAEREAGEEDALRKARAWDDFRDDNKRGSGNSKLRW